ncbi:MAG: hypothetical protein Q9192_008218 [Flavoplaca navasiana]
MPNNNHEGWRGFKIAPIGHMGRPTYPQRPNVVLLMAGTNDILMADDVENAPQRLEGLIGEINVACPDAAILVATIPVLNHPITNPNLTNEEPDAYNAAITAGIEKSAKDGKHVALVNMSGVTRAQINRDDGVHPTDEGYALIAAAWHESLIAAGNKGWIQEPWSESSQDSSTTPNPQNDKSLVDDHVNTIDDHYKETTDTKHEKPSNENPGKAADDNHGKLTANDQVNTPTDNHVELASDATNAPQTLGYQQLLIAIVSFLVLGWAARKATNENDYSRRHGPTEEEDDIDLLFVRKFVLEEALKAYRDANASATSTEALDVTYARMLCLADLFDRLLQGRLGQASTAHGRHPGNATQKQIAGVLSEKNFLSALTAFIADVDLNFPQFKRAVKYYLKPLKQLTSTAMHLSETSDISTTPGQTDDDKLSSASSVSELDD